MVKEKKEEKTTKKGGNRKKEDQQHSTKKKVFMEDIDRYNQIDFTHLDSVLKKLYQDKEFDDQENVEESIGILDFILRQLEDEEMKKKVQEVESRKIECIILISQFYIEKGEDQGVLNENILQSLFELLKDFKGALESEGEIKVVNYDRNGQLFNKKELAQTFHNLFDKLNEEFHYTLRLISPFKEQFQNILNQKTAFFLDFMDDIKVFYKSYLSELVETQTQFLCDVNLKQLEHIYHLSDDFVLNCE